MNQLLEHVVAIELAFFTPFDLPVSVDEHARVEQYEQDLAAFSRGHYRLDTDQFVTLGASPPRLLGALRTQYRERIREVFRRSRQSSIIEFEPINVSHVGVQVGVHLQTLDLTSAVLTPIIVIHGVGTGVLTLWLDLGATRLSEEQLFEARSSGALRVTIDQPYYGLKYLHGPLTLTEVADFLILIVMKAGQPGRTSLHAIDEARAKAGTSRKALETILQSLPDQRHIYSGLEPYFAACMQTDLASSPLHDAVVAEGAFVRGLITGDRNWKRKSSQTVERLVPGSDVSTRASIAWFMQLNGAVKLYSSDLETPYEDSIALMSFELDVLLTQRLVLLKSSFYLSTVSRTDGYKELLRVRESQLRVVNEFYSSSIAFKDTTAARLEYLVPAFRLDSLQSEADKLLEGLSASLQASRDTRILQRQTFLTVVFSAFGGASVAFNIAMASHKQDTPLTFVYQATAAGFVASVLVALVVGRYLLRADR